MTAHDLSWPLLICSTTTFDYLFAVLLANMFDLGHVLIQRNSAGYLNLNPRELFYVDGLTDRNGLIE